MMWAIPATYIVCAFGTVVAFVIIMICDSYPDGLADYVNVLGVGILWGTVIFIGTCYITVPMFSLVIAIVRYAVWGRHRKRES